MSNPWYTFGICVPFGDPNYDSQYGGSHDMDIGAPPNYPVTALLPGTIETITAPIWGKQVGIKLDSPYNGIPYFSFLHLSAVSPHVGIGSHVVAGEVIGYVGGATQESQYAGTSNPTGQNFLNAPSQSSRIQVGIALMRGPEYGVGAGWENFPPIDKSLDPTSLITDACAKWTAFCKEWRSEQPNARLDSGIAALAWVDYANKLFHGPAMTLEYDDVDWEGNLVKAQDTPMGTYHWRLDLNQGTFYPYH